MSIGLHLRPGRHGASAEPAAWFVPGEKPGEWFAEITRWNIPLDTLRLLPVPRAPEDTSPRGVVVLVDSDTRPHNVHRAQSYSSRAGILFYPSEAAISPPISDAELREFATWDHAVLHPSVGLIGFQAAQVLRIEDLCTPPPQREAAWDRADPGLAIGGRILGLEPELAISIEDFMAEGGEDIATESPRELPRLPGESRLPRLPRLSPIKPLAKAVLWFTERAPTGAAHPTWINRLEAWASGAIEAAGLGSQRARELERLMKLLEDDPDRGLRFALPLSGGAGRGIAPPSGSLMERNPDFSMGGLGSGRPVDGWDVPSHVQWQLHQRYRELANRELALGRHRRAAYIFAHLLHDIPAAAHALRDGRHFREAAALYEKRLNMIEEAGLCLEQGGLLTEAIELFEQKRRYERVGDLYAKLDAPFEAERAYRRAVDQHHKAGDHLGAARILEQKVSQPDEALEMLAEGWPEGNQARQCLEQTFALLGRLARHGYAERLMAKLTETKSARYRIEVAQALGTVASSYPEPRARRRAADGARVVIGSLLPDVSERERRLLLNTVRGLAPRDVLLGRDVQRYAKRKTKRPTQSIGRSQRRGTPCVLSIAQSSKGTWSVAAVSRRTVVVAGRDQRHDILLSVSGWHKPKPALVRQPSEGRGPLVLNTPIGEARPFIVTELGENPRRFLFDQDTTEIIEFGASLPGHAVGIARDAGTWWVARWHEGQLVLINMADNELLKTVAFPAFKIDSALPESALPIACVRGHVYLGLGESLCAVGKHGVPTSRPMTFPIRTIHAAPEHTHPRLLLTMERGVALVDASGIGDEAPVHIATDMMEPIAGFSSSGHIVVAEGSDVRVYRSHGNRVEPMCHFEGPDPDPFAVVRGPERDQVVLVSQRHVRVLKL